MLKGNIRLYEKLQLIIKKYYYLIPFFIFFIILLLFHYSLPTNKGDDITFIKKVLKQGNIIDFLFFHYKTWSSRSIIEFLLFFIETLPGKVWKFLDSIIFLIISISIPKLFIIKKISSNRKLFYNTMACLLVGVFIFTTYNALHSAGWIATTVNYLWPIGFGLLHFVLHKEYLKRELGNFEKIAVYLLMILSLVFAINQELMLIVIFGAYIFIFIYCLYKKIEIPRSIYIMFLIVILGLLYFVSCPGNHHRYLIEMSWWFPNYGTLTLFNKLDIGTTTMFYNSILKIDLVILLFFGVLGFYNYFLINKKIGLISFIPFLLLVSIYTMNILNIEPIISFIKQGFSIYGIFTSNLKFILVFTVLYVLVIVSTFYGLIKIYTQKSKTVFYIVVCLLLLAIASQMFLGFSPTVWASAGRWWIIYHALISIATFVLIVDLIETKIPQK